MSLGLEYGFVLASSHAGCRVRILFGISGFYGLCLSFTLLIYLSVSFVYYMNLLLKEMGGYCFAFILCLKVCFFILRSVLKLTEVVLFVECDCNVFYVFIHFYIMAI